jgi:predicted O-methyltransferase YrrM
MKSAADAILRPEQAAYLDGLHTKSVHALATLAGVRPEGGHDPLLARMEAHAAERGFPISDPEVACLLAIVARIAQPKLVVELGTNIGYGAIVLARGGGPQTRVVTVEFSGDLVAQARSYIAEAGLSDRIEVRQGEAIAQLERIGEPIDLLYIDCVKEEYPRYLEIAAPKLALRGVIVADNALWRGEVAHSAPSKGEAQRAAALKAFNLALVSHPDLCAVVLPFGDGVALATRIR